MDDRLKFMKEYGSGRWPVAELARRHGISRKTAHEFIARFKERGAECLCDLSRARHAQDHQVTRHVEQRIVAAARQWGCWGQRKLGAILKRRAPDIDWPAKSTVGDTLKRHGLVTPRHLHRPTAASSRTRLAPASEPNDLWSTDF